MLTIIPQQPKTMFHIKSCRTTSSYGFLKSIQILSETHFKFKTYCRPLVCHERHSNLTPFQLKYLYMTSAVQSTTVQMSETILSCYSIILINSGLLEQNGCCQTSPSRICFFFPQPKSVLKHYFTLPQIKC